MSIAASIQRVADRVWYGEDVPSALARCGLAPLSLAIGLGVKWRNSLFDRRAGRGQLRLALPALSVGNLTVGGTGKTPVASWFVSRLEACGARPAVILRGYGDDEWRVHGLLTPGVPVVVGPDRVGGAARALEIGADCVVLDDAFQHRQAARVSDVVLVSADRWQPVVRLLPAGPYREPLTSLNRATAVVVTVKAASLATIEAVLDALAAYCCRDRISVVRLALSGLHLYTEDTDSMAAGTSRAEGSVRDLGRERPAHQLAGLKAVLVSAIADPASLESQLAETGALIRRHLRFPDHHEFTRNEVSHMVQEAGHADGVVCTLKDAVKLGPLWPRFGPPLWYLSQTLVIDRGGEILEQECARLLAAR